MTDQNVLLQGVHEAKSAMDGAKLVLVFVRVRPSVSTECLGDGYLVEAPETLAIAQHQFGHRRHSRLLQPLTEVKTPVSYTHLTLPTICSV